jgi:hypothetical protein
VVSPLGFLEGAGLVSEAMDGARDLVASDGAGLNPVKKVARAGVRAWCRMSAAPNLLPTNRSIIDYVCEPLFDEPGNAPPSPDTPCSIGVIKTTVYGEHNSFNPEYTFYSLGGGAIEAVDSTSFPGFKSMRFVSGGWLGGSYSEWGDTAGSTTTGIRIVSPADASTWSVVSEELVSWDVVSPAARAWITGECGGEPGTPNLPIIGDPYTPDTPLPTPIGPIKVRPGPTGPIIELPDGSPVPIPIDPIAPEPDPEPGPEDPITPNPPQTPDSDGDVDFGAPPDGYEWVGAYWVCTSPPPWLGRWAGQPDTPVFYQAVGSVRLRLDGDKMGPPVRLLSERGYEVVPVRGIPVSGARVTELYPVGLRIQGLAAKIETTESQDES